jgi:hypothetical protein
MAEVAVTVLSEAISLVTHLQSNMDSIEGAQIQTSSTQIALHLLMRLSRWVNLI